MCVRVCVCVCVCVAVCVCVCVCADRKSEQIGKIILGGCVTIVDLNGIKLHKLH